MPSPAHSPARRRGVVLPALLVLGIGAAVAMLVILAEGTPMSHATEDTESRTAANIQIPRIDAGAPAVTRTATFALG